MFVTSKCGDNILLNPNRILTSIFEETSLPLEQIGEVVDLTIKRLKSFNLHIITGPLIREVACVVMLELGYDEARRQYTRVGMPVYDAMRLSTGGGIGDNANLQHSPETTHKRKADAVSKEQWLLKMPKHLADLHVSGDFHIHDLEYFGERQFCLDSDLRFFFYYGFVGDGTGEHTSYAGPAKRPEVAIMHAAKVLGCSQVCCAGGQGFYNFITFLAPFFEGEPYDTYLQCMQMFIYEMTQMLVARGGQTVFSSIQLSPGVPKLWRDIPSVYKGMVWADKPYGIFEHENRMLFKACMDVMLQGDYQGKPFYFPKPEINIAPEFLNGEYDDLYLLAFELASKYGTPYFDNTIPKFRQTGGVDCYQCCAYSFNASEDTDKHFNDKLYFKDGAHFSMGSYQVMTLNLPRLAMICKDADIFLKECEILIDNAVEVFKYKRELMQNNVSRGGVSFLSQSLRDPNNLDKSSPMLVDFDALVWTIGIVGINEVVKILSGYWLHESKDAQKLAIKICIHLKKYCATRSQETGMIIAFSRTPAETTAQRFAVLDMLKGYDNFVCQGNVEESRRLLSRGVRDLPIYYTNGAHVSPNAPLQIAERVMIEQAFFPVLDGGNICHIWLGEKRPDARGLMDMTMKLCKSSNVGYFSYTRDFTIRTEFWRDYNV